LVHKTKDAIILANTGLDAFEVKPEFLILFAFYLNIPQLSRSLSHFQIEFPIEKRTDIPVVENIFNQAIVDCEKPVARFDAHFLSDRTLFNSLNQDSRSLQH